MDGLMNIVNISQKGMNLDAASIYFFHGTERICIILRDTFKLLWVMTPSVFAGGIGGLRRQNQKEYQEPILKGMLIISLIRYINSE
jgi:hypothetical protein